ncbi:hypothetical protein V8C42DRAFT_330224 [Trichoderma barbatum]
MRGLSSGALHLTAAQASPPATHILASCSPPPLAPPPRPAAPDRLFVRSQALRPFVPPLDQLGSNRRPWATCSDII